MGYLDTVVLPLHIELHHQINYEILGMPIGSVWIRQICQTMLIVLMRARDPLYTHRKINHIHQYQVTKHIHWCASITKTVEDSSTITRVASASHLKGKVSQTSEPYPHYAKAYVVS